MSGQAMCPQCGTTVGADWAWCHECGFDPEGNRPGEAAPAPTFGVPATTSTGAPDASIAGDRAVHPYADLPYSSEPDPGLRQAAGYGLASGGLLPAGPLVDDFGPTRAAGPGTAAPHARPTGPTPGYSAPPGFAVGPSGRGFVPAPAASNSGRAIVVVMVAVFVLVGTAAGLVKVGSGSAADGPKSTTTRDPSAPPPMGAIGANAPSTVAGAPTTLPLPTSIPQPTDGWMQYHAPDGTFQVEYPAKPLVQSKYIAARGQTLDALNVIYEVGVDGGGYSVVYLTLPSAAFFADSRAAFEATNENNKLAGRPVFTDAGDFIVDGVSAVRVTGEYHGRPEQGAIVVKGLRLYEIDALDVDEASFKRFLASFHILKDPVK